MSSVPKPWPDVPVTPGNFREPPREFGILPFWFLNGALDPDEMRYQLGEFRNKGMPGIILHARYGLEMPYIGDQYLDRIRLAVEEAKKLGLKTWIYDEMNWPSGTADKRVLQARPDLAQRYIECLNMTIRGPWFTYLTGGDSRYIDFEHSKPLAAFAIGSNGQVIDLTQNLSFENVIPWEAPEGSWRLMYIVEKEADYYIDALNPESTAEFLRMGYEPYAEAVGNNFSNQMLGFYTDEPAMHYYVTGGDNPIVPWTRNMFRRFQERNGYNLRPHLPDLFFDINDNSARVRYDFYNTLTEFYSHAYYQQIHEWCRAHGVLFTGHLLYEEWLRKLLRVEGNLFKHYPHMDVVGVDHLYPTIGNRDRPDEHVAIKVGSSAAHQLRSPRLLCESFGGIFMDATMQRMKWIADWEYVLGVNLLNPHGFHYTLEGPRKRDWPPSMFYQYPWWCYYGEFSKYISRLSHLLSGGRHVANVAVLWPLNGLMANYTPQSYSAAGERLVGDFNALTDMLLRIHHDFDYIDEDVLSGARVESDGLHVADETYRLVILPPMTHIKLSTLDCLEQFVAQGGRVLGTIILPACAFAEGKGSGLVDISARVEKLFGVDPLTTEREYTRQEMISFEPCTVGRGKTGFIRSYALARQLPMRLQKNLDQPGLTESPFFVVESTRETDVHGNRYYFSPPNGPREDITDEVNAERECVTDVLATAVNSLITADITIDNPDVFYLHRVKDEQDIYFLVNSTASPQIAAISLPGDVDPELWDPSTGNVQPVRPSNLVKEQTQFKVMLPPIGSVFVLTQPHQGPRIVDTNLGITTLQAKMASGYAPVEQAYIVVQEDGIIRRVESSPVHIQQPVTLVDNWTFETNGENALVIGRWFAREETSGQDVQQWYTNAGLDLHDWQAMVPGAWPYQLPAEPEHPYPLAVWYRIPFMMDYQPEKLGLIIDGFAGSGWKLYVNGQAINTQPVRSKIDSQMQEVEITHAVKTGENFLALRLEVTQNTDGLLDLIKLVGHFSLELAGDGSYHIAAPRATIGPAPWNEQGYPFFSGRGIYRCRFQLPEGFIGQRVFIEVPAADDSLEVLVNGQSAGVRLWPPYNVDITEQVKPGENELEICVANTLINLLEAKPRTSGLIGAPILSVFPEFTFNWGSENR